MSLKDELNTECFAFEKLADELESVLADLRNGIDPTRTRIRLKIVCAELHLQRERVDRMVKDAEGAAPAPEPKISTFSSVFHGPFHGEAQVDFSKQFVYDSGKEDDR